MQLERSVRIIQEGLGIPSQMLERTVQVDLYIPEIPASLPLTMQPVSLLLINDGQDLGRMGFGEMLENLTGQGRITPLVCAGIHAGEERVMEYGTAGIPDFAGRGAKADKYARFIIEELLPALRQKFYGYEGVENGREMADFAERAFAGFSLGALSAMDIVWDHPRIFSRAGLFSGSFWWRTRDKSDPAYNENRDRIMQQKVRDGGFNPWLKFFFECGSEDEQEDRNGNGIIDSIDDTQDLIRELVAKGYTYEFNLPEGREQDANIRYLEVTGGRHETGTWARVMPQFLEWGWEK